MTDSRLPRRGFLSTAAGSLAAFSASAYALENRAEDTDSEQRGVTLVKGKFPVKAISSHNGLQATKRAYELLRKGSDTLDAAVAGVTLVEDDPNDTTVGYGGLPNEEGVVELDAAVMHGPTHRAGAVASLQNIKHAAQVARLVMQRSDHVLLVGEGAHRFAKAHGFRDEEMLTDKARKIWLYWKETLSKRDDWLAPPTDELDPDVVKFFKLDVQATQDAGQPSIKKKTKKPPKGRKTSAKGGTKFERPTGTIHCAAMDATGDISCTTTTSGLAFKIPGRVGDSPIIGAGLYVDNEIGSCGSTGRGEANLQNLCSFAAVELMRNGASPEEAGLEILRRVAAHAEPRLRDADGRPNFNLKFYLLAKDGSHAGVSMWGPADSAITDTKGTRLEKCVSLFERSK